MTPHRKQSNLFEAILNSRRRRDEPKVRTPGWWNDQADGASTTPERQPRGNVSVMSWLASPSRLVMPRALWIIVLAAVIGLLVITYRMGHSGAPSALSVADARSQEKMSEARRQDANPLLLSQLQPEQTSADPASNGEETANGNTATKPGDPRTPGMNYFCLETMPGRYRAEAERAAAFLRANGVDAAIVPVNNGRIQLVALKGFSAPYADPQAQEYHNLLRSLGRAWKLEHKGWSDWSDSYPSKYSGR